MPRPVLAALITLAICTSAEAQIDWISWDPMTIRASRTEPVRLEVQASASSDIASVTLEYPNGGSLQLTPAGAGRFTADVPALNALASFDAADCNRNFVGHLRLRDAKNQDLGAFNAFISVLDERIPHVTVTDLPNAARRTERILNVHRPLIGRYNVEHAVRQLYEYFPDNYDFTQIVFTLPTYPGNRYHSIVHNEVMGIGLRLIDASVLFGSRGTLLGINVYPIDTLFDAGELAFSHETGHQWINYLDNARLQPGPHWPPSSMASGVMGFNLIGGIGGEFPFVVSEADEGHARLTPRTTPATFTDFDLYLMGLLPPSEVRDGLVLDAASCSNCTVPATRMTMQEVIALHGPRVPSHETSKKSFRVATVVVSRDRLLTDDELALFEYFAARGEAREPLPFTSGLARGMTSPFYVATRGLATVDLRLDEPQPRRRAVGR